MNGTKPLTTHQDTRNHTFLNQRQRKLLVSGVLNNFLIMSSTNSNSDGPSATDIITYVGVPLAVAGVLPIAYTATTTLIYRRRLLKKLEESQTGAIRSTEILNRVVEVQYM